MTFADKLKELREKAGLTQAALAVASGLSLGAIRDYEQGNKEPVFRSGVKLARALDVSVEALAEGIEDGEVPARSPRAAKVRRRNPKKKRHARS
jgi:transcriptional regulator with XRE-family HTH domain